MGSNSTNNKNIMRKKLQFLISILLLLNSSCSHKVSYLDENYPYLVPKIYANTIINTEGRFIQNITMSPSGKEVLLGQTDSAMWRYERILRIKKLEHKITIDTPQFVKDFKYEHNWFIGEPMISPDNKDLYFVADLPPNYWNSKRTKNGEWSTPFKMDSLSTEKGDWYMSSSGNNTLYFTDGNIFKSPRKNGKYNSRIKVKGEFNELDAGDPCISKKEDYMIFASVREGGYGQGDIYVSFNDGKGSEYYILGICPLHFSR